MSLTHKRQSSTTASTATKVTNQSKRSSAAEQVDLIAISAYHRNVQRRPADGTPEKDWLEAEAEIDLALERS